MGRTRIDATKKNDSPTTPSQSHLKLIIVKISLLFALWVVWYIAYVNVKIFYSSASTAEAKRLINTKRAPEAEAAGIRAVLLNPDNGYAHYYLGAFYFRQQRLEDAENELRKALRTIAHPATPLLQLAEIHLFRRQFKEALRYFDETFKMNPKPKVEPGKRWYSYAKTATNAGNLATAIYAYQQSLDYGFKATDIHRSLGAQFFRLGLNLMAIFEFERQVLEHPESTKYYIDLVTLLRLTGDVDEGIRFFSKLLNSNITNRDVYSYLALFCVQKKEYDLAISTLSTMLKKYPEDPNILFLLGISFYEKREREQAEKYLHKFIQMNPSDKARKKAEQMLEEMKTWK